MEELFEHSKKLEKKYPGTDIGLIKQVEELNQEIKKINQEIKQKEKDISDLKIQMDSINLGTANYSDTEKIEKSDKLDGEIIDLTIEKQLLEDKKNKLNQKISNN